MLILDCVVGDGVMQMTNGFWTGHANAKTHLAGWRQSVRLTKVTRLQTIQSDINGLYFGADMYILHVENEH
jgi:hypothetical protein